MEERGDWLLRFPSPRPLGNATNDLVSMEWYAARDIDRSLKKAPAVVVVHESGRGMTVGRIIARGLNAQGLHAFLLHMPGYGARRVKVPNESAQMLAAMQQGVADARRARDAVVALPCVDDSVVGLQGTSLGGFVTATVAGMDDGYDRVFILLAGGNLHDVILSGQKDAAGVREKLRAAGMSDEQIVQLVRPIEPLRLAHRINPASTWLYSGKYDDVVPPACSMALVEAARLSPDHHIEMPADHYSGVIYLPMVLQQMYEHMTRQPGNHK
jgi:dienelactone hydrolase